MSRSNYKYLPLYNDDMMEYFFFSINKTQIKTRKISKLKTITKWNNFTKANLHQGRYSNIIFCTNNHLGFKFGQFTKTRKPFFFRGKKK